MSLLLLFHPQVIGGVNPEPPPPIVLPPEFPQGGGAVYPQMRGRRKKRQARVDAELLEMLAIVIPLIERNH